MTPIRVPETLPFWIVLLPIWNKLVDVEIGGTPKIVVRPDDAIVNKFTPPEFCTPKIVPCPGVVSTVSTAVPEALLTLKALEPFVGV